MSRWSCARLSRENGAIIKRSIRKLIVEAQPSGDAAADDPDRLLFALLATFDGLVSRVSDPMRVEGRKHFPDAKIILRMVRPDVDTRRHRQR